MASYVYRPIDEASPSDLIDAFGEACERQDIAPDSDEALDLTTVLWHAFGRGITTRDALLTLVSNITGK